MVRSREWRKSMSVESARAANLKSPEEEAANAADMNQNHLKKRPLQILAKVISIKYFEKRVAVYTTYNATVKKRTLGVRTVASVVNVTDKKRL